MELRIEFRNKTIGYAETFQEALEKICQHDEMANPSIPAALYNVEGIEPSDDEYLYALAQEFKTPYILTKDEDAQGVDFNNMELKELQEIVSPMDYTVEDETEEEEGEEE